MTQVLGVRAARWIPSLVVCGLAGVAVHIFGMTLAPAALAQDRTSEQDKPSLRQVTVGVPRSFPPYYLLDEYGNPSGFAVDVMEEVAKRAGLLVTYRVKKNWGEIFKALRTGDIDIVPNLGITNRRKEYAAYTVPLETFHISIFVRDDTHDVKGLGDLSGRPVAVVATNAARRILQSRDDIQLRVFDNFTEALFALLSTEVDAFAFPEPVTWKLAREARVDKQIKVVGEPLKEIRRGMAVPKDKVELLAVLDRAVRDFVASPEYRNVYVAWFGKPDPYWTVARVAWTMGGLIAVLFLFMGWWRYRVGVRMIQVSQKSEKRLRGAIESLQEGFELFDADDRLVMINSPYQEIDPQAQEFLDKGMSFEDVIRANVAAGRMVEALGREEEFIRERLEQHRNPGPPILRQYNDGKWYIITETRTPEGGIAITFSDVTELQTAKEAREKLSKAVENVPVGIALFDSDDRLVFFNNRYGELMEVMADILKPGVTFEEMVRTLVDRQPVEDARGREEEFIRERMEHHRNPTGPYELCRPDRWLQADENRMPDGSTFVILRDITERMRIERAREEAEERFRSVFDNVPIWLSLRNLDGRYLLVNKPYADRLGKTVDEIAGKNAGRGA
jgi:PAS domain-containing protein/ABC-type amino acid transport substrate-binding protein